MIPGTFNPASELVITTGTITNFSRPGDTGVS